MNIINDVLVDKLFPDKPKRTKEIPLLEEKSVSGESIIIRDAYPDMPFKGLHVYGKSTQVTTTGAQLLNPNKYVAEVFGIKSVVENDGSISIKGITNKTGNFRLTSPLNIDITTEMFFGMEVESNVPFSINHYNNDYTINAQLSVTQNGNYNYKYESLPTIDEGIFISLGKQYLNSQIDINIKMYIGELQEYEPYTGGKPSPSIEYPQEIVSVGDKGSINVDVDNNGYIQKGTYFYNISPLPLVKGKTYHIKGDSDNINCFVFNEINESLGNSANLYDYGYGSKQLKAINNTGIVDNECRLQMDYKNGYSFEVTVDGLYLYQGVNQSILDTDDFYIGHHADIVDEEYKKQTLTLKTPNGLLGIPVSAGGNYTDSTGQQWVCDEIDLAREKYVQRVEKAKFDGSADESWAINVPHIGNRYASIALKNRAKSQYDDKIICNIAFPKSWNTEKTCFINEYRYFSYYDSSASTSIFENVDNFKQWLIENPIEILYILETPIERDLTPEEVETYKALHTNYPTTVIMNDENAGMKVTYLTPSFIPTRESALRIWFKENPII